MEKSLRYRDILFHITRGHVRPYVHVSHSDNPSIIYSASLFVDRTPATYLPLCYTVYTATFHFAPGRSACAAPIEIPLVFALLQI